MKEGLLWLYEDFKWKLLEGSEVQTSYEENWKYIEYSEWYGFRENLFKNKVEDLLNKQYFKQVFLIVNSAILSSNNEEQFLNLLNKYLSSFLAKKLLKSWEDFEEKKTFIWAYLDFQNNDFLKNKLQIEKFNWWKYNNSSLIWVKNKSIVTLIETIYDEIEKNIFNNNDI